jgi:hypothetical protein
VDIQLRGKTGKRQNGTEQKLPQKHGFAKRKPNGSLFPDLATQGFPHPDFGFGAHEALELLRSRAL